MMLIRKLWVALFNHGLDGQLIVNGEHVLEAAPGLTYYIAVGSAKAQELLPHYYAGGGKQ